MTIAPSLDKAAVYKLRLSDGNYQYIGSPGDFSQVLGAGMGNGYGSMF
jgi:hypothetical protein